MYKTILVPLDGSKCAESILPHVEAMAKGLEAELVLMTAVEHAPPSVTRSSAQLEKEYVEKEQSESKAYLDQQKKKLEAKGVTARVTVLHGRAVSAIIEAAQHIDADLIAMGSHGRSGLTRAFYGSVASGVLNRVDRPLLLVRPKSC
jgi:nucleotide-binding universal stress UspA family protein